MTLSVQAVDSYAVNMDRRMPFHFGNVTVTKGPQVLVDVTLTVDETTETGLAMGAAAPMWFFKDPDMTIEEGCTAVFDLTKTVGGLSLELPTQPDPFSLWLELHEAVDSWAEQTDLPPLFYNYGVSLVEQAVIDAFCRATETPFPEAVAENTLGIDLGAIHEELAGSQPHELLPDEPRTSTAVRHTVGLGDPLTPDDVAATDRLDDGLPQVLSEYIDQQGVDHFKIKLAAEPSDADRLAEIREVVESRLDEYSFTLDANEQYETVAAFRDQWNTLQADDDLEGFFDHLLYVEQPLPRDEAFTDETAAVFDDWADRPPVIIDESDDRLESLPRALETGYAGTSHKNCKGVFKGIANRCLIAHHREQNDQRAYLMSGEDLTTLGPVELQEDLAVMAVLGMDHVERNGHHYFRGLGMLSDRIQEDILHAHGDLYTRHAEGFPTLAIEDGRIALDSVLDAPFGYAIDVDTSAFIPIDEWTVESIAR